MQIIHQLFEVIMRRRAVSDLTYDPTIAIIGGAVLMALGGYTNSLQPELESPMFMSVVQILINTLLLVALLRAYSKGSRSVQVLSALYGVSALLQTVALLAMQLNGLQIFVTFILVWNFILSIIILREGLETTILAPLLWTVAINMVTIVILLGLFPDFAEVFQAMLQEIEKAQAA